MAIEKRSGLKEAGLRVKGETSIPATEHFLLMSVSPDDGIPAGLPHMGHDIGFAGAILIDLMLCSRIEFNHSRVEAIDLAPTGHPFLDKALQKFNSVRKPLTLGKWLELLAEDAGSLKQTAFKRLTERGLIAINRRVLVNGFEAHSFPHTKNGVEQSLIARMVRSENLDLSEVLAVCVANACGMFDVILSKEQKERLDKEIERVVGANTVGEEVIETVEATSGACGIHGLSSSTITTGKNTQENNKAGNWEWRAFWFDQPLVIAPCYTVGFDETVEFKTSKVFDCYLLLPERRDNIKMRKRGLEVKTLIKSHHHYEAFRQKEVFKFPIEADDLSRVFPRISHGLGKVSDELELEATLRAHGYAPTRVNVEKVRNRVRLSDHLRLEFCKFTVEHRCYWSACIEGPDFSHVRTCVHNINPQAGQVMGYIDFLHRMIGDL